MPVIDENSNGGVVCNQCGFIPSNVCVVLHRVLEVVSFLWIVDCDRFHINVIINIHNIYIH
jgi:hypothetical protein